MPPHPVGPSSSNGTTDGDADDEYNPSAEAMVNDFDDERTLDEEEEMQDDNAQDEINDLQKDAEMPLDELLAYYSYVQSTSGGAEASSSANASSSMDEDDDDEDEEDDADYDEDDDDVDDEAEPEEESGMGWRRLIKVGPEHQASIPDELCPSSDVPAYENPDLLMWASGELSDEQVDEYLRAATSISRAALAAPAVMVPAWTAPPAVADQAIGTDASMDVFVTAGGDPLTSSSSSTSTDSDNVPPFVADLYMSQSGKQQRAFQQQQGGVAALAPPMMVDPVAPSTGPVLMTTVAPHTFSSGNNNNINNNINSNFQQQHQSDNYQSGDSSTTTTSATTTTATAGAGPFVPDEDQLLYLLLQCNHNIEEALRRRAIDPFKYYVYEPMSPWSDEECLRFEKGLRQYGKNFHTVSRDEVTTRKISEVIAFYYIWKKSERHDMYVNQYNAARATEYNVFGGVRKRTSGGHAADSTIDHMDRFVDRTNEMLSSSSNLSSSMPGQQQQLQQQQQSHQGDLTTSSTSPSSSNSNTMHNKLTSSGVSS